MKKFVAILFILVLGIIPLWAQQSKEDLFKEQAREDVHFLSPKAYKGIDNFHAALRQKLRGNTSMAKSLFLKALKVQTQPKDGVIYFALAEITRKEKKIDSALYYYQKAYDIQPDNTIFLKNLAEVNYYKGNFKDAAKQFLTLCEKNPRNTHYRYGYSKTLIYNKEYKKAIHQLDLLQEQTGSVPELRMMQADLYIELKEKDKAEKILLQLGQNHPDDGKVLQRIVQFYTRQKEKEKIIPFLEKITQENKENGVATFMLTHQYLQQGKTKEFTSIAPQALNNRNIVTKHKLIILKHLKNILGNSSPVIDTAITNLYKQNPDDATISLDYGRFLISKHQSKKALNVFRNALNKHPDKYNLWSQTLLFEKDYKMYKSLYEDSKKALTLFPSMPFVYFSAAGGALFTGKPQEAMQNLENGKMFVMEGNKKQTANYLIRKGQILFYQKKYKKGIVAFEKALSLSDFPPAKIIYALSLAKANIAPDVTLDLLKKVKEKNHNKDYYYAYGLLLLHQKKYKEGISILKEGIKNTFNFADLYDLLGDLYIKSGTSEKAIKNWKKAIEYQSMNKTLKKKIKNAQYYTPKYY